MPMERSTGGTLGVGEDGIGLDGDIERLVEVMADL